MKWKEEDYVMNNNNKKNWSNVKDVLIQDLENFSWKRKISN